MSLLYAYLRTAAGTAALQGTAGAELFASPLVLDWYRGPDLSSQGDVSGNAVPFTGYLGCWAGLVVDEDCLYPANAFYLRLALNNAHIGLSASGVVFSDDCSFRIGGVNYRLSPPINAGAWSGTFSYPPVFLDATFTSTIGADVKRLLITE